MTVPIGNISASGAGGPDDDLVPVPCKCCGELHPACGCWNIANANQLVGHECLVALQREHGLGMVWNSRHPSQQRSALYFHQHRLEYSATWLRILTAALSVLEPSPLPEIRQAIKVARQERATHEAQVRESAAFLDEHDPTRRLHA